MHNKKKIGIITLPFTTNYGGILQAYALQKVISQIAGEDVEVVHLNKSFDDELATVGDVINLCLKKIRLWFRIIPSRLVKKYFLGRSEVIVNLERKDRRERPIIRQYTDQFIEKYIKYRNVKSFSKLKQIDFETLVVGSDQIWRKRYLCHIKVRDAFLYFASDWNVRKISYAASFGTDNYQYSNFENLQIASLLKTFDAISVREISAVAMCSEIYNVNAIHVLDPTMLLDAEHYKAIVPSHCVSAFSSNDLIVYMLDESVEKQQIVEALAKSTNLCLRRVCTRAEDICAPLESRIQPPLEQWLAAFDKGRMIVTDSFHACVFAIIYNKPFICFGNKERGSARFDSLLKIFRLQERLIIEPTLEKVQRVLQTPIDWAQVNYILSEERSRSMNFLKMNLSV